MSGMLHGLSQMALPLLIIVVVSLFMFVVWLLYSSEQNKKATQGKIKAYILLENKILWKGLCDYSDTKVRAPWNKGGDANKKGDRTQVFTVEGESVWYDRWPDKGWFTQTIPAAFFHEREICAIFPPVPCDCGHEECQGKKVQELTPSQLGLMEDEHVTEATMKATMWVKEMFDKMGELMAKLPPAWITFVGFGLLLLALIAVGFLVYQMRGDVGWLKTYLQPPVTPGG